MEHLLQILGRPRRVRNEKGEIEDEHQYQQATYRLGSEGPTVETPFVGEAIVRLCPDRFDRVHIFGSEASMWQTLYNHCLTDEQSEEETERYFALYEAVDEESFDGRTHLLDELAARLSSEWEVDVQCHLLPLGQNEEEYWEMLRRMVALEIESGTISIDVTHGLRVQPLFLLLSLFYFRGTFDEVEVGSVFYGAYDLRHYYDGITPVIDLSAATELVDWTEAARAFDRYGDAQPIAELLRERGEEYEGVARRAEYVSKVLQLNTLEQVPANMGNLLNELERAPEDNLPLQLIRPRLEKLPREVAEADADWEALLRIARRHWNHFQAGYAVLAAWEAVIARIAEAYDLSTQERADHSTHQLLGNIARGWESSTKEFVRSNGPRYWSSTIGKLSDFRNGIAHANSGGQQGGRRSFHVQNVYDEFPKLLSYLETNLGDDAFDELAKRCCPKALG